MTATCSYHLRYPTAGTGHQACTCTDHQVSREQAEILRSAVAEKFAAYIDTGPDNGPKLVDGLTLPGSETFGAEWLVVWEDGPFEWALRDLFGTEVDEELTAELQDIAPGAVIRDRGLSEQTTAAVQSAGIMWEPLYSYALGVYQP